MAPLLIAPSLISADFGALADAVAKAERGGADLLHLDVMDGHFVPNITFGPLVVRAVRKVAHVPLDVHLMIEDADRYIEAFVDAGASRISVHVEALPHLHRTVHLIKRLGAKAGVAFNPATPVDALKEIAADLDHVLLMSVNPGFSGQTFIPHSESKLRALGQLLSRVGSSAIVEVDGGIDHSNAARVVAAGADVLVSGQTIFGADNVEQAVRDLRAAAAGAIAK
jgi:ribulose-phosphate 3-epimerase